MLTEPESFDNISSLCSHHKKQCLRIDVKSMSGSKTGHIMAMNNLIFMMRFEVQRMGCGLNCTGKYFTVFTVLKTLVTKYLTV